MRKLSQKKRCWIWLLYISELPLCGMCSSAECCVVIQLLTPSQASKHRNCSPSCEVAASWQHKELIYCKIVVVLVCIFFGWAGYRISIFKSSNSTPSITWYLWHHHHAMRRALQLVPRWQMKQLVVLQDWSASKVVRTVQSGIHKPNPSSNRDFWNLTQSTDLSIEPVWSKHVITISKWWTQIETLHGTQWGVTWSLVRLKVGKWS